jgi:hypothetical protein
VIELIELSTNYQRDFRLRLGIVWAYCLNARQQLRKFAGVRHPTRRYPENTRGTSVLFVTSIKVLLSLRLEDLWTRKRTLTGSLPSTPN